ncbi:MAG: hypothetical protein NVSMB46_06560 [Candidatus Saccharimonadales bacterium]
MDSLRHGVDRLVQVVFAAIPHVIGAIVILIVAHIIAKALANLVRRGLRKAKFNERLHAGHGGSVLQRAVPNPSKLVGQITYWVIYLGGLSLAASILGIELLNRLITAIYGFIPSVIVAVLIFLVGSAIAAGVTTLVKNVMGDTPTGKVIETMAPVIVIGITIFMILDQLGIAPIIVTITYGALLGAVALGSALAFGLGGRDTAAKMLETAYQKGQEQKGQIKRDVQVGKDRSAEKAQEIRSKINE